MKITKKQWEEIQEYIGEYAPEIWDMAVRNTTRSHDAEVWLDGISTRKYSLWAGMYTTGTVKNPDNVADSLLVYQLPRNWQDYMENIMTQALSCSRKSYVIHRFGTSLPTTITLRSQTDGDAASGAVEKSRRRI